MLDMVDSTLSVMFVGGLVIVWVFAMLWAMRKDRDFWRSHFHKEQSIRLAMQDALMRRTGTAKIYDFSKRGER